MAYHHRCRTERNAVIEHGEHVTSLRDGVSCWIFHFEAMKQTVSLISYCVSGPQLPTSLNWFSWSCLFTQRFQVPSPKMAFLNFFLQVFLTVCRTTRHFPWNLSEIWVVPRYSSPAAKWAPALDSRKIYKVITDDVSKLKAKNHK